MPRRQNEQVAVRQRCWDAICTALILASLSAAPAQIIDRVLAVVAGEPITLSDVNAAVRLGYVALDAGAKDPIQAALTALIEHRLQLIEVNRYVPPEPTPAQIEARLADVRARLGSPEALAAALVETGVNEEQLRAQIRDVLRIESYHRQRFGGGAPPAEDEIVRYYRSHEADFVRNGVLRPYNEVRSEALKRLVQERTASLIRDWIDGLRRRADVTVLPR
jgi:hypothetical protein